MHTATTKKISNSNRHFIWATTRSVMETENHKHKREGASLSLWTIFIGLVYLFERVLKVCGVHRVGMRNARSIRLKRINKKIHALPESFRQCKILHLSDLHIDALPNFEEDIVRALPQEEVDFCFITGDFRMENHGEYRQLVEKVRLVTNAIHSRYGIYAVLGNHDPYQLPELEEEMGLQFLINESISVQKGIDTITITGTDDPYRYYTDQAMEALTENIEGFKIALVHTAELAELASKHNYNLYFCGHTHGGQVCLPGGKAIITHQNLDPTMAKGGWTRQQMLGYTSVGCGVSGIPVRYFCPPEIVLFELE